MTFTDRLFSSLDHALRTLAAPARAARPNPAAALEAQPGRETALSEQERRLAGALMRVNHVGEVCAQALYQAQALTARSDARREHMRRAAREETDHLAWTEERLHQLGARTSLLNPVWYGGAFGIGLLAGRLGDAVSLGFLVETERQVEAHLASHLSRLPDQDAASRAIVDTMKADEAQHADAAAAAGGAALPKPVRWMMKGAARLMTATAHHV
jgi:3-demethoxyubiquinol 3-hydroxylase